jgi:hypothetical protein
LNLSYTRTSEDVREARRFLQALGMGTTKIMAKIETRQVGRGAGELCCPPAARQQCLRQPALDWELILGSGAELTIL